MRQPSVTPPYGTPELCKQGLDVQCVSMTVSMSSCGSKGQVRDTHLHSRPVPDGGGMGQYLSMGSFWYPICRSVGISACFRQILT